MEPFKNIFNKKLVTTLAQSFKKHHKNFDTKSFEKTINKDLTKLEMKDRVRLIANTLESHLSSNYKKDIALIIKVCEKEDITGFSIWIFTQYIENFGLENFKESMQANYFFTSRFSSEFSIRPFLENYYNESYTLLNKWVKDSDYHVRRLVSEGTRPNLPWGMKVKRITENPKKNIPLLKKLKNDSSEYVRKSVANHLNDISYLDPKLVISTLKDFSDGSAEVKWITRHALRTLLKKGHPDALKMLGYNPKAKIKGKISLDKKSIKEGDKIELSIDLKNETKKEQKIIVDYIIHYKKSNGTLSPKVFRFRDTRIKASEKLTLDKVVHFKRVTTRRHYPGDHFIELQINGNAFNKVKFKLTHC